MNRLRKLISIANVTAQKAGAAGGQISTLLLLAIVAALIFALATANMGRTVTLATTQDNATDSGALLLGSQLATKSHGLWKSFGEKEQKCKTTSWLSTIFSIILAVAAVVTGQVYGLGLVALMLVGAAAGAAGGALGGQLGGTGALQGAIQGAITGAAIGAGAAAGSELGGALGATPATAAETALGVEMGLGVITSFPSALGATIGSVAGGAMAVGSNVFNQYVQQQMVSDAIASAAKALNGLPERDQFRENVFLTVLAQTLDDPNRTTGACYWPVKTEVTGDPFDANGNGNVQETISCFEYWFERRVATLKEGIPAARAPIEAFLGGPLATFQAAAERTYTPVPGSCGPPPPPPPPTTCTYTLETGSGPTFTFGTAQGCPGNDNPCFGIVCNPGDTRVSARGWCNGSCNGWTWGMRDPNGCFYYESANNKGGPHCEVTCAPPGCRGDVPPPTPPPPLPSVCPPNEFQCGSACCIGGREICISGRCVPFF